MKHSAFFSLGIGFALALHLLGCSEQEENAKSIAEMPTFPDQKLTAGRRIWSGTCRACHLLGVEGAPAVMDYAQWEARLPKGKEVLAQSVINGIRGNDGKYRMPPRGGNKRLTDEQIELAVKYKIAAIKALNQP